MNAAGRILTLALPLLTAFTSASPTMTPEEEVKALIGTEFTPLGLHVPVAPGRLSCIYRGGGMVIVDDKFDREWINGYVQCGGRDVVILSRIVAQGERWMTERIVDALLMPPLSPNHKTSPPTGLIFYQSFESQCDLLQQPFKSFVALIRWRGEGEVIDWRTGVERAWTYDLDQGRIVPLSTKDIICEYTAP